MRERDPVTPAARISSRSTEQPWPRPLFIAPLVRVADEGCAERVLLDPDGRSASVRLLRTAALLRGHGAEAADTGTNGTTGVRRPALGLRQLEDAPGVEGLQLRGGPGQDLEQRQLCRQASGGRVLRVVRRRRQCAGVQRVTERALRQVHHWLGSNPRPVYELRPRLRLLQGVHAPRMQDNNAGSRF